MQFFKRAQILLAAAIMLSLLFACEGEKRAAADFNTAFPMKVGNAAFKARIAYTDLEKARGLMFVKELPENEGMIFIYDAPMRASFWMKNTFIPLDLAFFDKDGVLTEIKNLYPHNLDSVKSARSDIAYCIEMNSGWFKKNAVENAAKLDMDAIKTAISARKEGL